MIIGNPTPPLVLVFAASDPSGGAGIQADILTLASLGCHPLSALTAITVQDTVGVDSVHPIDASIVERQARTLLADMRVVAFKIGVLGSVENVVAVAHIVAGYPDIPVVFDPVLTSGRGDDFSGEGIMSAMCKFLLPRTTVLTPNAPEARWLAGCRADEDEPGIDRCAQRLIAMGAQYVLITGTHENTPEVINTLYGRDGVLRRDCWDRLPGSYHGSGCTLASAIAGYVAGGAGIDDAVRDAQDYTWQTLANGFRPGQGQFIPERFFRARSEGDKAEMSQGGGHGDGW
ncbi:MAG: hydroxymethylpyrimidine/phosphomethylpyrimidine kinase [Dechloromonas sp.]|nr:hydroxymethylpyrimidine/phosphomethylpyrimidine kinase [Dechloromonas sp.]